MNDQQLPAAADATAYSEALHKAKDGGVYWEADLGGQIIGDGVPLVLELRQGDGTIIVRLLVNPQMLGGKITGIGAW